MRYQALMTAFTLSLGIWACRERDDADIDTTTVPFDTGMAAASAPKEQHRDTAAPVPATPDGEVLGSFIEANEHEAAHGRLASTQGSTQPIRDLGKSLVRDHDDLIQRAKELAAKQSITAAQPAGDPVGQGHVDAVASVKGKSGVEFDRAFLKHEVEYHTALLKTVNSDWIPKATNQELKTFLQQAIPAFQAHLKAAQDLSAKLPASQ